MPDHRQHPIKRLEVSTFSVTLFKTLGLDTIGDLCDVSERSFLAAAADLQAHTPGAPARAPAKSLREVKEILADMGLCLKAGSSGL